MLWRHRTWALIGDAKTWANFIGIFLLDLSFDLSFASFYRKRTQIDQKRISVSINSFILLNTELGSRFVHVNLNCICDKYNYVLKSAEYLFLYPWIFQLNRFLVWLERSLFTNLSMVGSQILIWLSFTLEASINKVYMYVKDHFISRWTQEKLLHERRIIEHWFPVTMATFLQHVFPG